MNMFALSFVAMLAFVLAELLVLKFARKQAIPWREVIFNLNSGHILMWVLRGVEVGVFGLLLAHANVHLVDRWPVAAQWLFAFIGWDFCFYWMHRLHHRLPIFWAVHVVHHQGEHFNLSLGIRNSWYSSLTSLIFVAILAVLGVPLDIFLLVSSFHYSVQLYNHNALVGKSGILDRFLVTPSNHRVHHGIDARYMNKNFGGTFLIWDRCFGTYQAELEGVPMQYGVPGAPKTDNPLWASNAPLLRLVQRRWPGLRQAARFAVPDWFIGAGGVLLFGMVIYYVDHEGRMPGARQGLLFALIFGATIALGGLSDAKRWGALAWSSIAVALPLLFLGSVREPWALVCLVLLLAHGLDGWRRLFTRRTDAAQLS
ncbi:sterol desaturase/sphingolipid hydroxylase (fatty acid hydroxylase superfamily) [Oxalobacteraceae bacterium GrIS 1.11]